MSTRITRSKRRLLAEASPAAVQEDPSVELLPQQNPHPTTAAAATSILSSSTTAATSSSNHHHPKSPRVPHPLLDPPVYSPWTRDVSTCTRMQRAALYTAALRARDEAIVSAYTDPVELDFITPMGARLCRGRFFEKSTLEELCSRACNNNDNDNENRGRTAGLRSPWNRQELWKVAEVLEVIETPLSEEDQQCVQQNIQEYQTRFSIREAWESTRDERPPLSIAAHQRLIQGQAGTQPTIWELRRLEAEEQRSRVRALLRQIADEDQAAQQQRRVLDALRRITENEVTLHEQVRGDESVDTSDDDEEEDQEGVSLEDAHQPQPMHVWMYQQFLEIGRSLNRVVRQSTRTFHR